MKLLQITHAVCLAVALLAVPGCKGSSSDSETSQGEEPIGQGSIDKTNQHDKAPTKVHVWKDLQIVDVAQLPELGDPIGPLDDGRIKVSPPEGWYVPSRSRDWIVRFKMSRTINYPHIGVTAEDYENIFNVSKDNVDEFARQIAAALDHSGEAAKLAKGVTPIRIGSFVGITYQRRAKAGKNFIDRLFVETVVAGRKYAVELWALRGTLKHSRPYLMAAAAGIEFLDRKGAQRPKTRPPDEVPQPPADEPPRQQPQRQDREDPFE